MTEPTSDPFSPQAVEAIARHMNDDHAADNVVICRGIGSTPDATAASVTGLSPAGIEFSAVVDGATVPVLVAWSEPVTERAQVRAEVVRMFAEASAALGLEVERH